jgi:hypothetical protein
MSHRSLNYQNYAPILLHQLLNKNILPNRHHQFQRYQI